MRKITAFLLTILMSALMVLPTFAAENEVWDFGRVFVHMPDIRVEITGTGYVEKDISAVLGGKENLKIESFNEFGKDHAVHAYIILDLSIPVEDELELAKECIEIYVDEMDDNDTVTIYAVNDKEVLQVNEETDTKKQIIKKVYDLEQCESSILYDAIVRTAQEADSVISNNDREYLMVFSDGLALNNMKKLTNLYKWHNLPLYALCTESAYEENVNRIDQIAAVSGGNTTTITSRIEYKEWKEQVDDVTLISFKAGSNIADGKKKQLAIHVGDTMNEFDVKITKAQDDTVPPEIKNIEYQEENHQIVVDFSEPVTGISASRGFEILDAKGNKIGVESVTMANANKRVEIRISQETKSGEYLIKFDGVTDCSKEANALLDNEDNVVQIKMDSRMPMELIIVAVVFVMMFIGGGVLLIVLTTRKRGNVESIPGVQREYEYSGGGIPHEKHHIKVDNVSRIRLRIRTGNISEQNIETNFVNSLIVGRSSTSDVYIDDGKLSRQHFVIESKDGKMYLSDLQSSNGTFLNGIRVNSRQPLNSGDKIMAGLSDIYVTIVK